MSDVTRILNAIETGDTGVTEELLPLVYDSLVYLENINGRLDRSMTNAALADGA